MKTIRFQLFCTLSLILGFISVHTGFARAPTTARIVFFSLRDDNSEIYTMAPDGSQQRNLTKHPSTDREPVWSPKGEHILFALTGLEFGSLPDGSKWNECAESI